MTRLLQLLTAILPLSMIGCGPAIPGPPKQIHLITDERIADWSPSGIPEEGNVEISSDHLEMGPGQPMTGVRFTGDWTALQLPLTDYRLTFEARRTEGRDFFATTTFPVGSLDQCVSLVVGGWGGGLVGISSIDYLDASENSTRGEITFENDQWYRIRIEVRPQDLRTWINDLPMVNVSTKGRRLHLRHGDIDQTTPLGFATWRTTGQIRDLVIERL